MMRTAAAAVQISAPSPCLLKFLRSQVDTCFFTHNAAPVLPLEYAAPRRLLKGAAARYPVRRSNTSSLCKESQQNNSLDSLWSTARDSSNHTVRAAANSIRHASTWSLWQRMQGKKQRNQSALNPNDVPGRQEDANLDSQFLNLSRSLARAGAGAETKLRCTEFDSQGAVTLVSGEFKKSELIAKYGLLPRDLRKIDSSLLPHVLVRHSSILMNLLHLRVLIQADRVLVFDAYGTTDSYTQSLFMYDLEGKLRQKSDLRSSTYLPYEFRALEAVLISVTSSLESEFEAVREPVVRVLRDLEEDIDRDKLRHLLINSKKLGSFEQKARLVRNALDDLLEADDDLVEMYLTERAQGKEREEDDHQEVEMLLESYHKICDEIVESSGSLVSNIRNTEEIVKAILDANRNSLMLLDLRFSIWTLGLAAGTLVAGLYGMNLKNFFEESDAAFTIVTVICFGFSAVVGVWGSKKLSKVQRLRMWGEGYNTAYRSKAEYSRGNWRSEALEQRTQADLARIRTERLKLLRESGGGRIMWPSSDTLAADSDNADGTSTDSSSPSKPTEHTKALGRFSTKPKK